MQYILLAIFILAGLGFTEEPWYNLQSKPGANFYEIKNQRYNVLKKQTANEFEALTKLLSGDHSAWERAEYGIHFSRWATNVERKVAPSGDLSLMDIGYKQALKYAALDGFPLPPMSGDWSPLGPFSENTDGSGRLNWIAFHPTQANTFMVGSSSGGMWTTKNGGDSWETTTDKLSVLGAGWAAYDPTDPNIIYLGTGDGNYDKTPSMGLLKTTDGGENWNTTGLTFPIPDHEHIHKVAFHTPSNAIFVTSSDGLYRSTDGGEAFSKPTGISDGEVFDIEFHPTDNNIVYVCGKSFFRSTDGGQTFSKVNSLAAAKTKMEMAVSKDEPGYVYIKSLEQGALLGIYRSTNAGVSFTQRAGATGFECAQAEYNNSLAANPNNAEEVTAGCVEVFRSTNGGQTWTRHGTNIHSDVHDLAYTDNGDLYALHDGGISVNTSGTSWSKLNSNLNVGDNFRMGVHHKDYDLVCSGRQDNGVDIHHSMSKGWGIQSGGDGFDCFWNLEGDKFYLSNQGGRVEMCNYDYENRVSLDRSAWCDRSIGPRINGSYKSGLRNSPWTRGAHTNTIYAGRNNLMVKTLDGGVTWELIGTLDADVQNLVVAPSDEDYIYTMTGSTVIATTNGGDTWKDIWPNGGAPYNGAVSATDPKDVWVAVSGYEEGEKIYHSTDGGATWTNETSTGLPNVPANTIALDAKNPGDVYLGTDIGVYYRNNEHTTWQNFSNKLPNADVLEMEISQKGNDDTDRMLVAGTYGRGIWRTRLWRDSPIVGSQKASVPLLNQFSAQVKGNKLHLEFNLVSNSQSSLPSSQPIMQLVTLSGRTVFEESLKSDGIHSKVIDLANDNKGMYLFIIKNGSEKITKSIVYY